MQETTAIILSAKDVPALRNRSGNRTIIVAMNDGEEKEAFSYYNDEISINTNDLIGMTMQQAVRYKIDKDIAYLRS